MTNLIEDIGFTNPESKSEWNNVSDIAYEKPYFGQLDPNWRKNAQAILDEQREEMERLEDEERAKGLPKEILILGVGTLVVLTFLIVNKYKNK